MENEKYETADDDLSKQLSPNPTKQEYIQYWATKREVLTATLERNGIVYDKNHTGQQIAEMAWDHTRFA
jgi:hypothetical protein